MFFRFFRQTRLTSFQRQLNLYGFNRLTLGKDQGAYYSEYFLKGKPLLCMHLKRTKVKGTYFKAASNPKEEPDLYSMPSLSLPDDTENDSHVSLIDRSNDDSHITCSSHGENKLSWSTLSDDHRKPLTTVAPLREFVKSNTSFEPTHLLNQSTSFEPIELKDVPFDAQIELLYTEPLLDFDPPKDSSIPNVISDATIVPSLAMGTTWGEPLDEWYDESLL